MHLSNAIFNERRMFGTKFFRGVVPIHEVSIEVIAQIVIDVIRVYRIAFDYRLLFYPSISFYKVLH